MSSGIIYPTENDFRKWIEALDPVLIQYLPHIDDSWFIQMTSSVAMLKLSYYSDDIFEQAAILFVKIIMNHYFFDGNKRSAVISIYLFCSLNKIALNGNPDEVYLLAKDIASKTTLGKENYKDLVFLARLRLGLVKIDG